MEKAEFFWAIVGDSAPEPVAVTGEPGQRKAYTIGCPDPFDVDGPDANIQLIHRPGDDGHKEYVSGGKGKWGSFEQVPIRPLVIPMTPTELAAQRAASEARLERDRKRGISHGYAGFGARAR